MRRLVILVVFPMVTMLAGCDERTADEPDNREQVKKVLTEYSRAVYGEIIPRIEGINEDEMWVIGMEVARKKLLPHKDLLMAEAEALLAELPPFDWGDREDWESLAGPIAPPDDIFLGPLADCLEEADMDYDPARDDMLFVGLWNPLTVFVRTMARAIPVVPNDSIHRCWQYADLYDMARPVRSTISADPANPIIVAEMGPAICVVTLRRAKTGYYHPTTVEFLARKIPAE